MRNMVIAINVTLILVSKESELKTSIDRQIVSIAAECKVYAKECLIQNAQLTSLKQKLDIAYEDYCAQDVKRRLRHSYVRNDLIQDLGRFEGLTSDRVKLTTQLKGGMTQKLLPQRILRKLNPLVHTRGVFEDSTGNAKDYIEVQKRSNLLINRERMPLIKRC